MKFQYYLPVNILFGRGKVSLAGKEAAKFGKRIMIVTGGGSSKKSGLLDRVQEYLALENVETILFDKVTPNPLTTTAVEGAEIAKYRACDAVIAIGGGSIMDCAKAIAFMAKNNGDINDYIYNRIQGVGALPIIAIPTTCGTGSEGNGFAVLTNPENGDKKSLRRDCIIPSLSIIDSQLMQTMPKHILSSVCFDALCHSMEAYLSKSAQPMSSYLALHGIQMIAENLADIYSGSDEPEAWDKITWASAIGGMVIHTAGVTLPHGMEHPASGLRNIAHGRGLASLTPVVTDAGAMQAPEKYKIIANLLGKADAADCGDAIRMLLEKVDLQTGLSSQGILPEDIPWMVKNCFKVSKTSIANHPVLFDEEGLSRLYEMAM